MSDFPFSALHIILKRIHNTDREQDAGSKNKLLEKQKALWEIFINLFFLNKAKKYYCL